jgi:exonuclease SbcC
VARLQAELEAGRRRAADLAASVAALSAELGELLGGHEERLEDVIAGRERLRDVLVAARQALLDEARCARTVDDARSRAHAAAVEAGFVDTADALAAHLSPAALALLEERVGDRDRREQDVRAVLTDPDLVEAAAEAAPDLPALVQAAELAGLASREAAAAARVAERIRDRLVELTGELDAALSAWSPVRDEHVRVRALAELVEGKGSENVHQMRLSAYVLAARLGQVVAAANERLGRMLDDRYLLEHVPHAAGDRRGGLSIAVHDQWTGERRDPLTLSGGETFVVSLALALGLADVVTAESGGTRIDTLFVDEGFGSLDADTLEEVMDVLDGLREGGRSVGVVSHVAELRDRITTRLEVHKGRSGSRVVAH